MGSADEGWSRDQGSAEISVELGEVALKTLASGDPMFECGYCKRNSKQKYRCKRCASKLATLSKMFWRLWPIPAFERLPDDQKVAFWRTDSKTRNNIMNDLSVTIPAVMLDQEVSRKNGKYLQLSGLQAQDRLFKPLSGYSTHKDEKQLLQNRVKKWDPDLQEYVYLLEAASGDLHT